MARDPLRILLAIHRRSVEQARSVLGVQVKAEAEAADKISALDGATRRDRETGAVWRDAYQFVDMVAIRQDVARAERERGVVLLTAAQARSANARGVVTAARTAVEAVEQIIGDRAAVSEAKAMTHEQHVLDDILRVRHALRRRRGSS